MREVYEQFFLLSNERFKKRLEYHKVSMEEFQKRWDAHDETIRQDATFKDLYDFQSEIGSFDKFVDFMKTHVCMEVTDGPDMSSPLTSADYHGETPVAYGGPTGIPNPATEALTASVAAENKTFEAAKEKEILVFWDTENVPPAQMSQESILQLRDFIRKNNIGNPLHMYVEAFFCPGSTLTLNPRQMWGLRQAGVTMVACCERKKEEVDRQMERRIHREISRTNPAKSVFMVISGDADFNQVIQDVAMSGYQVHLLTPADHSSVISGTDLVHPWHGFRFRPVHSRPNVQFDVPAGSGDQVLNDPTQLPKLVLTEAPLTPTSRRGDYARSRSPARTPLMQRKSAPSYQDKIVESDIPVNAGARTGTVTCARFTIKWWKGSAGMIVGHDDQKSVFAVSGAFIDSKEYNKNKGNLVQRVVLMYTSVARLIWNADHKNFTLQLPPPCLDLEVFQVTWWQGDMGIMKPLTNGHPYPFVFVLRSHFMNSPGAVEAKVVVRQVDGIEFRFDEKHCNYRLISSVPCLELYDPLAQA
jgi:hypothetical protein